MKATISFTLPDEQHEFDSAMRGSEWRYLVYEVDEWLRSRLKHADLEAGAARELEMVREYLRDGMQDRGLPWE